MKFRLSAPCDNCPFRREGGVRLTAARAREVAAAESFPCHKTVDYSEDPDGVETRDSCHCAGHLIYREKIGRPTQMMRIAERLGLYDRSALAESAFDLVVDGPSEMVDRRGGGDASGGGEDEVEREYCGVCEAGCENPAGYLSGGEVEENEDGPLCDEWCEGCGAPMCDSCRGSDGLCVNCDEEGGSVGDETE